MRLAVSIPDRVNLPLAVGAFCLIWSSAYSVAKLALYDCPPLMLLTARFLFAGVIMMGAAAFSADWRRLAWRDAAALILLGVLNYPLYLGLNYYGMLSLPAGLSALIISANPVLTALLAAVFLDERMTWRKGTGLLLGVGGVTFILGNRLHAGLASPVGIAFTLGALLSLVVGTILFKRLAPNGSLWIGNGMQNLAGGLAVAPFAFTFERIGDIVPTTTFFLALAYSVVFVSIGAYLLWFHLLKVSGATAASAYHFLMPPLGVLFGWLILGERVELADIIGILPVALGIYLVTRPVQAFAKSRARFVNATSSLAIGNGNQCPSGRVL
ncbi:MAG: DMT family transporter [Bradyrhizobiaceae bacterium]|nr:DMT family transporter [Bradyrhizobiaceae bacterium]